MTTPAFEIHNPGVFEVPVPPHEFGQDGGKFYRCYDALAEEIDDDMVNGLKEQLDGILIFAGLFAGVNSAFLALTLPLMSPDPADDTNALLREKNAILLQLALGRNDSLPSAQALPSETFSPAGKILTVNALFSVSLMLALISSFMAVLGRQWLVYYRKRSGGGPDRRRWEQLKRFLGAERWGLEWALDDFLPSILQIGLIIFCISLTIYLSTLHPTLSSVVGTFMCAGLAILIITALLAAWDKFCPFQSPLPHLISQSISFVAYLAACSAGPIQHCFYMLLLCMFMGPVLPVVFALDLFTIVMWLLRKIIPMLHCWAIRGFLGTEILAFLVRFASLFRLVSRVRIGKRQEEGHGKLQILAIKRAIRTSDDALTLLHGVSNILAIRNSHLLDALAADDEFTTHLSELWRSSYRRTLHLRGRDQLKLATAIQCLYRAALAHVLLSSSDSSWVGLGRAYNLMLPSDKGSEEQRVLLPSDLVQNVQSNMINAYLSCVAFDCLFNCRKLPGVDSLPPPTSLDVLLDPTWKRIGIILEVIVMPPKSDFGEWDFINIGKLRIAYAGDPAVALDNLDGAVARSSHFYHMGESRDILKQYLVPIFKFAGKATVDGAESPGIGTYPAAKLLRLSEMFMRAEDSPSNFIDIGRSLRRELISVLASVRERSDVYYKERPRLRTLDQLILLFTNLTAPSKLPTIFSNEDDLDLVSFFSPILRHLQAVTRDPSWVELEHENSVSEVKQLDELFRDFKVAVESVCRKTKRRDRDPEMGQWCYRRDEDLKVIAY